ncbi:MAG: potassium/proton antiporter [Lentisphaeria bacterium]|nr:potassium/proton antiporter [Lentisphaeria bacterium]
MSSNSIITVAGLLLLAGAFANKISSRFNLPTLLLFLAVGIFAENLLPFEGSLYAEEINFFGIIAMCFILFSGGGETSLSTVRKVAFRGVMLAIPGVMLTALFLGTGAYFLLERKHSLLWCLLLAALISSTDAAAVFAILRGKGVGLKGRLRPLLELESGSNDPTAAFLTLLMIGLVLDPESRSSAALLPGVLRVVCQLGGGVAAGIAIGWLGRKVFLVKLEYEGLYFVVSVAWVLLSYGLTQCLGANGFMACYVCGITLNAGRYNYQKALSKFHNGVAWLMQVALFTVLGFLADPELLMRPAVWVPGVVLGLFLIFVARPLAVFLCLLGSEYSMRERLMISWVGIRGAAPIVLATFPLAAGVQDAELMFRLIFFMVLVSITFQGWLLMPAARLLKLAKNDSPTADPPPLELEVTSGSADQEMREFKITPGAALIDRTLAQINFPPGVLVTMIRRGGTFVPPNGRTVVKDGDGLLIMGERRMLRQVAKEYFPGQHAEDE